MSTDIAQALERDGVFGNSDKPDKLVIRKAGHDDAVPAVLREGSGVTEFETEFMLVSLAHGQPNQDNTQFNVLKRYDYPVMNRFGKKPTQNDFKGFI